MVGQTQAKSADKIPATRLVPILRLISPYLRPHVFRFMVGVLAGFGASGAMLALPWFGKQAVDIAARKPASISLDSLLAYFCLLLIVLAGCRFFSAYFSTRIGNRVVADLRHDIFHHTIRLPAAYHEGRRSADLVSVISNDAVFIRRMVATVIPMVIGSLPIVVIGSVQLFSASWRLTLVLVLAALILVGLGVVLGRRLREIGDAIQHSLARVSMAAQESFLGIRAIKALSLETYFAERHAQRVEDTARMRDRAVLLNALFRGLATLTTLGLGGLTIWLGTRYVLAGEMGLGDLTAYATFVFLVASAGGTLAFAYVQMEGVLGMAGRVVVLLSEEPETLRAAECSMGRARGHLRFEGVTFTYPGTDAGVFEIDLDLAPGGITALTGPNGSGKSTLIKLALNLYEPHAGNILLDGHSSREAMRSEWRSQFGWLDREPSVFGLTVGEYISLGKLGASHEDVIEAARLADAHNFIGQLPHGYETTISEVGVNLSAGQRQRIAFAQLILHDPCVILLDEALTSLDFGAGETLMGRLVRLWKDRTVLVVTHRAETIELAQRVVRLEDGRIARIEVPSPDYS